MKGRLAFPERHGGMVLFVSGIVAWIGAIGAVAVGQDPAAVAAVPTGAGLIGAAAYYSRVKKFAGVELADEVLEEGGSYEASPNATPTEAVQDFAFTLAGRLASEERTAQAPTFRRPYFLHVSQPIPRGMAVRATWEGTEDFARYLEEQGWGVQRDVRTDDGRVVDLLATRDGDQLWVEVKGVIYALNPAIIREISERLPSSSKAATGIKVRRALFLPTPPLAISPEVRADLRENQLELWYADARVPDGFVKGA